MSHIRTRTNSQLTADLEKLARTYVSSWIEQGMLTSDMTYKMVNIRDQFESLLIRDIRYFRDTGKYPEYPQVPE